MCFEKSCIPRITISHFLAYILHFSFTFYLRSVRWRILFMHAYNIRCLSSEKGVFRRIWHILHFTSVRSSRVFLLSMSLTIDLIRKEGTFRIVFSSIISNTENWATYARTHTYLTTDVFFSRVPMQKVPHSNFVFSA